MRDRSLGPDIPLPDYDDPKELYAFFGLAAYCAGLLESSLLNLLAAIRASGPQMDPRIHTDKILDDLRSYTFGRLLAQAHRVVPIEASSLQLLEEARERRNYLIHHFFRDHAETALNPQGVRQMIDELRDLAVQFRRADDVADPLWRAAWLRLGLTQEIMDVELDRMWKEASERYDV